MGGILSNQVPEPNERMKHTIAMLKLTPKDLQTLYRRFSRFDKEVGGCKSGTIDRREFYASIDEEDSRFGDAIFVFIDEDNSGVLDFTEYVEALGKFCLLNKEDMFKLCFNVFDNDKNGTIENEELNNLLEMLHEDEQINNIKHALKSFDFNGDGKIDFDEFKQLNTKFPSEKWWERKIEELVTERHNKFTQEVTQESFKGMSKEPQETKESEMKLSAELKRQEMATRVRMGFIYYKCCPCRRNSYMTDDQEASITEIVEEQARPKHKIVVKPGKKHDKKQNIVPVGPRKPLSQEERLERARKRRLRDMQDRPKRKD